MRSERPRHYPDDKLLALSLVLLARAVGVVAGAKILALMVPNSTNTVQIRAGLLAAVVQNYVL